MTRSGQAGKLRSRYELRTSSGSWQVLDRYTGKIARLDDKSCSGLSEIEADAAFDQLDAADADRRAAARVDKEAI